MSQVRIYDLADMVRELLDFHQVKAEVEVLDRTRIVITPDEDTDEE